MSNNRLEKFTLVYSERDLNDYRGYRYNVAVAKIVAAATIASTVTGCLLAGVGVTIPVAVLGYSIVLGLIIDAAVELTRALIGIEKARTHINKNNRLAFVDISWDENGGSESLSKRKIENNNGLHLSYNSMNENQQGTFCKNEVLSKPLCYRTETEIKQNFITREIKVNNQTVWGRTGLAAASEAVSTYVENDACAEFKHYVKKTASSAWNSFCGFFSTPLSAFQTQTEETVKYRNELR